MLRQRSGHILNIASLAARTGARGRSNYAAAKAALVGFTLSLAREVGSQGVCVNAVLPGFLDTPMTRSLSAPVLAAFRAANVLERFPSLDDSAVAIEQLARFIHVSGQVFSLDGRIAPWC